MAQDRRRPHDSSVIKLVMTFVILAVTISAVTRFVDFSNSPITWTHAQPTQGKRVFYGASASSPLIPVVCELVLALALPAQEQLPAQPLHDNLYTRPPPLA